MSTMMPAVNDVVLVIKDDLGSTSFIYWAYISNATKSSVSLVALKPDDGIKLSDVQIKDLKPYPIPDKRFEKLFTQFQSFGADDGIDIEPPDHASFRSAAKWYVHLALTELVLK